MSLLKLLKLKPTVQVAAALLQAKAQGAVAGPSGVAAATAGATAAGAAGPTGTVAPRTLRSLAITPRDTDFSVGTDLPYSVSGAYSDGYKQEHEDVIWKSSADDIVSIDAQGVATAHREGQVEITATDRSGKVSDWTRVWATRVQLKEISWRPDVSEIGFEKYQEFHAWGDFSDGESVSIDDQVTWSSADPKIITITPTGGRAYGRTSGKTTITITHESRAADGTITTSSVDFPLAVARLTSITVKPATTSLVVGGEMRFSATGGYSDGDSQDLVGAVWNSADESVVTIDDSGRARGRGPGKTTVSAWHKGGGASLGTAEITVTAQALQSVRIDADDPSPFTGKLARGQRMRFRATGVYPLGSGKEDVRPLSKATWSSSDKSIVSMAGDGTASCLALGKAVITAEDSASGVEASFTIEVVSPKSGGGAPTGKAQPALPAAVSKPYELAKAKHEALQAKVRELDDIPRLVKSLADIRADIAKNPDRDAINEAQWAKGQDLQIKGITDQIDEFKEKIESVQTQIDSVEDETEDFKGRQEVRELREKGKHEKERIKSWLEAIEAGLKMEHEPLEAITKLVSILVERFHKTVFDVEADKLEGVLDAKRLDRLKKNLAQAKKDRDSAGKHLDTAKKRADEVNKLAEDWRGRAAEDFDAAADAKGGKKGAAKGFRFSEVTKPLQAANDIVDKLVPELLKAADAAALAVTKHLNEQAGAGDGEPGRVLHTMASDAYSWRVQAGHVSKQADTQRKELETTRAAALDALSQQKPARVKPGK